MFPTSCELRSTLICAPNDSRQCIMTIMTLCCVIADLEPIVAYWTVSHFGQMVERNVFTERLDQCSLT